MHARIERIIILLWIFCIPCQAIFSQKYTSRDNYTGDWETPATWSPAWTEPQTDISEYDITINGYITANASLSFLDTCKLTIKDTLVIKGNLSLNNDKLQIEDNGILIVAGDFTIGDSAEIQANGYVIIFGNVIKVGDVTQGKFYSNDNPVKVFVGGTVPPELTVNNPAFKALNCTPPNTILYPNTACSYGNMEDIKNDPIYSFFISTCIIAAPTILASGPITFCEGGSVTLTSTSGTSYLWSTGAITQSINVTTAGSYSVQVTDTNGCQSNASALTTVTIIALPQVTITSSSMMCEDDNKTLTGSPAGGTFAVIDGPGSISGDVLTATGSGNINIMYTYTDECSNTDTQTVIVNEIPVVNAGPDQELEFVFEIQMNAALSASETGEWSLISGSGKLIDILSPTTGVTDLSVGKNKFLWTVSNGSCEAGAEVEIIVHDLFVPSVITPNGDGKNDFFMTGEVMGRVELIIFNRWGIEEYTNCNFLNDWDGRNNKGVPLPDDTYFYVLKFENGIVKKGSLLIKR